MLCVQVPPRSLYLPAPMVTANSEGVFKAKLDKYWLLKGYMDTNIGLQPITFNYLFFCISITDTNNNLVQLNISGSSKIKRYTCIYL